jgi:ribose transport system substrate-binding protein
MKFNKLFLALSVMVVLSMLIAACAPAATPAPATEAPAAQEPAAPAAPAAKPYIPVISKGFQHQFWQAVKAGSEQAAKDFNVDITFEGPESEAMVDKQVEMFQTALDKKPAAICLAAVDSKAFEDLLQKAKSQNIPVIGFDSGVDSDVPLSTASTDNVAAAALAADKMVELIGGEGEVAIIAHDQTSRTGIDRVKGFTDEINNKYAGKVTIVDTQYGAGDQLKSTDLAKAIIQAHPNLKGFFGANEGSIIGVLNAVKELGKEGEIVVIGYDSGQQQLDAIRSGVEAGAITQNPVGIGYKCVEAAVKAINGETLPKTIDTGFYWFDKTNIDDPTIVPLLYK